MKKFLLVFVILCGVVGWGTQTSSNEGGEEQGATNAADAAGGSTENPDNQHASTVLNLRGDNLTPDNIRAAIDSAEATGSKDELIAAVDAAKKTGDISPAEAELLSLYLDPEKKDELQQLTSDLEKMNLFDLGQIRGSSQTPETAKQLMAQQMFQAKRKEGVARGTDWVNSKEKRPSFASLPDEGSPGKPGKQDVIRALGEIIKNPTSTPDQRSAAARTLASITPNATRNTGMGTEFTLTLNPQTQRMLDATLTGALSNSSLQGEARKQLGQASAMVTFGPSFERLSASELAPGKLGSERPIIGAMGKVAPEVVDAAWKVREQAKKDKDAPQGPSPASARPLTDGSSLVPAPAAAAVERNGADPLVAREIAERGVMVLPDGTLIRPSDRAGLYWIGRGTYNDSFKYVPADALTQVTTADGKTTYTLDRSAGVSFDSISARGRYNVTFEAGKNRYSVVNGQVWLANYNQAMRPLSSEEVSVLRGQGGQASTTPVTATVAGGASTPADTGRQAPRLTPWQERLLQGIGTPAAQVGPARVPAAAPTRVPTQQPVVRRDTPYIVPQFDFSSQQVIDAGGLTPCQLQGTCPNRSRGSGW